MFFFSFKLCFWTKEKSCLLSAARFYVEIGETSSHHWLITCQLFLNANGAEGPQFSCQTAQLGVKITSIANKPRVIIIHYHFFNSKYLFSPTEWNNVFLTRVSFRNIPENQTSLHIFEIKPNLVSKRQTFSIEIKFN